MAKQGTGCAGTLALGALAVVLFLVLASLVWALPISWLDPADYAEASDLIAAQNEIRKWLATLAVGAAGTAGLLATAWQISTARRQVAVSEQGQIADRFTRAVEQLASSADSIRIGGIFAIGRIAEDSPRDCSAVARILISLVARERPLQPIESCGLDAFPMSLQLALDTLCRALAGSSSALTGRFDGIDLRGASFARADLRSAGRSWRRQAKHRRAVTMEGWKDRVESAFVINLSATKPERPRRCTFAGSDLRGATFEMARLDGASFQLARLGGATFFRARLTGCTFSGADLSSCKMEQVRASRAEFNRANLTGADCCYGRMVRTDFFGANLARTDFMFADLRGADLRCADLRGADLGSADLRGADLTDARLVSQDGDSRVQLRGARVDHRTKISLQGLGLMLRKVRGLGVILVEDEPLTQA